MQFSWSKKKSIVAVILLVVCSVIFIGVKLHTKPYNANKSTSKTNDVVSATNTPASGTSTKESTKAESSTSTPSEQTKTSQENQSGKSENASNDSAGQKAPEQSPTPAPSEKSSMPGAVQDKANGLVSKSVSNDDYFKAASTILGKLSFSEMKYVFDSAKDDFWVTTSVDEINKIRGILFSKLSDDDLNTLTALGKKYGRSMTILRKDIDVAKEKEMLIERRNAAKK